MKKTLTFTLLLVLVTAYSYAQVDWAVKSLKSPTDLETANSTEGTPLNAVIECENLGSDTVRAGDSVIMNLLVISPDLPASNNVLYRYPTNATYLLSIIAEDVAPGATYDLEVNTTIPIFTRNSIQVVMGVRSYLFDRSNSIEDSDSANNLLGASMIWYNEYRNGVSVDEAKYNNKITSFPNPASNVLNVDLLYANTEKVTIELIDLTGKIVISENISDLSKNGAFQLKVGDLENGVYILKVTNGKEISTRKVSVAH